MVFNATFNNISVIWWRSGLLVEETGIPGEIHRPVTSHWPTLSHNVVSSTPRQWAKFELTASVVIWIDCTCSCKSNYHTITTTATASPPRTCILFRVYWVVQAVCIAISVTKLLAFSWSTIKHYVKHLEGKELHCTCSLLFHPTRIKEWTTVCRNRT